jgi:hypothetical protein
MPERTRLGIAATSAEPRVKCTAPHPLSLDHGPHAIHSSTAGHNPLPPIYITHLVHPPSFSIHLHQLVPHPVHTSSSTPVTDHRDSPFPTCTHPYCTIRGRSPGLAPSEPKARGRSIVFTLDPNRRLNASPDRKEDFYAARNLRRTPRMECRLKRPQQRRRRAGPWSGWVFFPSARGLRHRLYNAVLGRLSRGGAMCSECRVWTRHWSVVGARLRR